METNSFITSSLEERMRWVLDTSWLVSLRRIAAERIQINKESSLQLHYAYTLTQVGELACVEPNEVFKIELETHHSGKNIDIWCALGDCSAAIELKCFRKVSNRAIDLDMYDVLKDIHRLETYNHVELRHFICLTDNPYYRSGSHKGHAGSVSIRDGKTYEKNVPITPTWIGKWKDKSRDTEITFEQDIHFDWRDLSGWHYLYMEV